MILTKSRLTGLGHPHWPPRADALSIRAGHAPWLVTSPRPADKAKRVEVILDSLRCFAVAVTFILPLLVFPGTERPFSTPKFALLGVATGVGVLVGIYCRAHHRLALPSTIQVTLIVWLAALGASASFGVFTSPPAVLLPVFSVAWCGLVVFVRPRTEYLAWALVLSGAAIATVALLQFLGLDPFTLAGWVPLTGSNSRMRVFATLGNPNFVAAFVAGLLPLTFSLASQARNFRGWLVALFALQAMAILTTGSRAPILALVCASLWIASLRSGRLGRGFAWAVLSLAVCAAAFSPARNLKTTLRGRTYIWEVSAPHLAEHFLFGLGPGGFGAAFPAWETQYWQAAPSEDNRSFAGIEDHAHNDYLEIFADTGLAGWLAFVAVLFAILRQAWFRARAGGDRLVAGASAGVVALAAVAFVDFPLMRPTESFLFWSLVMVSLVGQDETHVTRRTCAE